MQEFIQKNGVELQPDDASDFSKIIADWTPVVEKEFPADSPQRIFSNCNTILFRISDRSNGTAWSFALL